MLISSFLPMICDYGGIEHMDKGNPPLDLKFYFTNYVKKTTWKEYQLYFLITRS
jgi:hypothetical protein